MRKLAGFDAPSGTLFAAAAFLCAFLAAAVLTATRLPFSYDEMAHTHMIWLTAQGQVPYADFSTNHLPFYWYLLQPGARGAGDAWSLLNLHRGLAAGLRLIWLGLLAAHVCLLLPRGGRLVAVAVLFSFAATPVSLDYLVRFAPDAIANVLFFGGLLLLRMPRRRSPWVAALAGAMAGCAMLTHFKYPVFAVALLAIVILRRCSFGAADGVSLAWLAAGGLAPILAAAAVMSAGSIPWQGLWESAVRYNGAYARLIVSSEGLLAALARDPLWPGVALAGLAAWFWKDRGRTQSTFLWACAVFVFVQPLVVPKAHSQYLCTWLMLAAVFPACLVARSVPAWPRRIQWLPFALLAAAPLLGLRWARSDASSEPRSDQRRLIDELLTRSTPDGYVVAPLGHHPVLRSNTFYRIMADYADGRDVYEDVVERAGLRREQPRISPESYARELRERPPQIVVLGRERRGELESLYSQRQTDVLDAYLMEQSGAYEVSSIPGTRIWAAFRHLDPVQEARPQE